MRSDDELNGLGLDELIKRIPSLRRDQLLALRVHAAALYGATGAALGALASIDQALAGNPPPATTIPPAAGSEAESDRGLTADQVAVRLGFTVDYVYRHKLDFPFARKVGKRWRFSSQGLADYLAQGKGK